MKNGQALLMLLVFMLISITVTSAAVVLIVSNSLNTQKVQSGTIAMQVAESGIENSLLRLLRNPYYTGETLTMPQGTAVINITGSDPYTLLSTGTSGNFMRKIQVIVDYTTGRMIITSWKEVY